MICGRTTYDDSIRYWSADGPTGPARVPVVVITHSPPSDPPDGGVYTFRHWLDRRCPGESLCCSARKVALGGRPAVGNHFPGAGLVDGLSIHLVPVLFGEGTRLTETLPAHIELDDGTVRNPEGGEAILLRVALAKALGFGRVEDGFSQTSWRFGDG